MCWRNEMKDRKIKFVDQMKKENNMQKSMMKNFYY